MGKFDAITEDRSFGRFFYSKFDEGPKERGGKYSSASRIAFVINPNNNHVDSEGGLAAVMDMELEKTFPNLLFPARLNIKIYQVGDCAVKLAEAENAVSLNIFNQSYAKRMATIRKLRKAFK